MNRTSILVATLMITMAACGGQPEPELPAPVGRRPYTPPRMRPAEPLEIHVEAHGE